MTAHIGMYSFIVAALVFGGCDEAAPAAHEHGSPTAPQNAIELAQDDESTDMALETIAELADQGRWEDGLEELLDPMCEDSGCQWTWTDLEQLGLGELSGLLPEVPEYRDNNRAEGAATVKAEDNPTAAGSKKVRVNHVRCIETEDVGDDEPILYMNGSTVWSSSNIKSGVTYSVGSAWKSTATEIELFERDVSWNDWIGSFTVGSAHPDGPDSRELKGVNGWYKVYYEVSSTQ